jgi:hypothetical protein
MRRALTLILSIALAAAATAFLLIHFVWRSESWANYTNTALLVVCLLCLMLLYQLDPRFNPFRWLSPNWRRVGIGISILLCGFPWVLIVGLGIRYGILPDNVTTGLVLLIPLAALTITGAYILLWALLARR